MAPKKIEGTEMNLMEVKPPSHGHLGHSSFSVSQEEALTYPAMCSIFKKHYVSHPGIQDNPPAVPPELGPVMHQDGKFFNEMLTETANSFEYRGTRKPVLENAQVKLSTTNFKMDSDLKKFNSFSTTNQYYFPVKVGPKYQRPLRGPDYESHIPNGDPGKAAAPISDYREQFEGHDTTKVKVVKARSMHIGGPPTIKGDQKCTDYSTTNERHFPYKWQHRLDSVYPATETHIPNGDPQKVVLRDTTMRTSFPHIQAADRPQQKTDCQEVSDRIRRTNFKQADGKNSWNDYLSTANTSYKGHPVQYVKAVPSLYRNHSDFPRGDRENDAERVNMTTTKLYHGNPALGLHNTILRGANSLTKSNVLFGEPTVKEPSFYFSTTTSDVFSPKSVPYTYTKTGHHLPSSIPIKYYKDEIAHTTAQSDFSTPARGPSSRVDSEEAMNKLKKTNFVAPWKNEATFDTTHQLMYTPKPMERFIIDPRIMQKSSVPLGPQTMLSSRF